MKTTNYLSPPVFVAEALTSSGGMMTFFSLSTFEEGWVGKSVASLGYSHLLLLLLYRHGCLWTYNTV